MLGCKSSIEEANAAYSIICLKFSKILRVNGCVAGVALSVLLGGGPDSAMVQSAQNGSPAEIQQWAAAARAQALQVPSASGVASQTTPTVIPDKTSSRPMIGARKTARATKVLPCAAARSPTGPVIDEKNSENTVEKGV